MALDVEHFPPRNRNNREVHLVYLRHLKESVDTLRDIVEESKAERPLDRSLEFACRHDEVLPDLLTFKGLPEQSMGYGIGVNHFEFVDLQIEVDEYSDGVVEKQRHVLVAKDSSQEEGLDFEGILRPVAHLKRQDISLPMPPAKS
ncbi:hypothetical protein Tco_1303011 [Tanacetum coccineum]